jgi:hypothetical protein
MAKDNLKVDSYRMDHPVHPPYEAKGGFLRDEAIMILRRFYITENTNGTLAFSLYPLADPEIL